MIPGFTQKNLQSQDVDPATSYIPFRFTSKELDRETGLYYYGARYYEPRVSRWMSADPAGWELVNPMDEDGEPVPDGWPEGFGPGPSVGMCPGYSVVEATNWYSYVSNNPVNYVDPTGEDATLTVAGGAAGAIGTSLTAIPEPFTTVIGLAILAVVVIVIVDNADMASSLDNESHAEAGNEKKPKPTIKRPKGVPDDWIESDTKDGGKKWTNPKNKHD